MRVTVRELRRVISDVVREHRNSLEEWNPFSSSKTSGAQMKPAAADGWDQGVMFLDAVSGDRRKVFQKDGYFTSRAVSANGMPVGDYLGKWSSFEDAEKELTTKRNAKWRRRSSTSMNPKVSA